MSYEFIVENSLEALLTLEEQRELIHWKKRQRQNFSMLGVEYRTGKKPMTRKFYLEIMGGIDQWMNGYMEVELKDYVKECGSEVARPPGQALDLHAKLCGAGKMHGTSWLRAAKQVGLKPQIIDWNGGALEEGQRAICDLLSLNPKTDDVEGTLKLAEVERFSRSDELDAENCRILADARILEHLKWRKLFRTLFGQGRVLRDPRNRIVIFHTPSEGNEGAKRHTSKPYPESLFLRCLERGAGMPIGVYRRDKYITLHGQILVAITIRAL